MLKNIKYSLLALLTVMGMASCSNDYEYEGAKALTNAQVFFAEKTIEVHLNSMMKLFNSIRMLQDFITIVVLVIKNSETW